MRGRRGMVGALCAAFVAAALVTATTPSADAQTDETKVDGIAEWRDGKGDCNTGVNVENFRNGTGSPYATVDMPATVTVTGRHVVVEWRDPGFNHGPFFGPIAGDIAENGSFQLTGHNDYDPSWTWAGTTTGLEMKGRFTRRAIFAQGQPPCTATWNVTLRLSKRLPFGETDTPGTSAERCPTTVTAGVLEPTQGVWQHDPVFKDRPGARLRQVNATTHEAELPMVRNRPTLVFGGSPHHRVIRIEGTTTGTTAGKTTVRVKASGAGSTAKEEYPVTSDSQNLRFFGPCGSKRKFVAKVIVQNGFPESRYFTFPETGAYTVTAQVESGGAAVRPAIKVTGTVVNTAAPKTLLVPVTFADKPQGGGAVAEVTSLVADAKEVAGAMSRFVPDFYPVASFPVDVADVYYAWADFAPQRKNTEFTEDNINILVSDVEREMTQRGLIDKYDRIVALLPKKSYKTIEPEKTGSDGFSASTKFVVIADNIDTSGAVPTTADTMALEAAHELAHTLPYLWTDVHMTQQCSLDYHNKPDADVAHGVRITRHGVEHRQLIDGRDSLMSQIYRDTNKNWIDQCTYANLLNQLKTS